MWAINDSLSHVVEVPRPSDGSPRHWRLYAKDAATKANNASHQVRLGQSLFGLWPNAKRIVSDPRAPKKPRWWDGIRDLQQSARAASARPRRMNLRHLAEIGGIWR